MAWPSGTASSRNLIRVWVEKYERGEFDDDVEAADLLEHYEARIAALERMVGQLALEPSVITGPVASPSRKDAGP